MSSPSCLCLSPFLPQLLPFSVKPEHIFGYFGGGRIFIAPLSVFPSLILNLVEFWSTILIFFSSIVCLLKLAYSSLVSVLNCIQVLLTPSRLWGPPPPLSVLIYSSTCAVVGPEEIPLRTAPFFFLRKVTLGHLLRHPPWSKQHTISAHACM